jgi:arylsulfatase A-like enzyme
MDAESSIGDNRHPMTPARTLCLSGWLLSSSLFAADDSRPDIVWIVAEDLSPDASCYGETAIQTPHLDALAARGVRFSRAFVTTPNRSVSHTGMITGVYPTTLGAHHHYNQRLERRSGNSKPYEASYRPPVKLVPELLQEAGYFTSLDRFPPTKRHGKASYNFEYDVRAVYDATNFRECPPEKPFFAQIMLAGGRDRDAAHGTSPEKVSLPPYYPDTPAMRRDRADYLNAWIQTDNEVGAIVWDLENSGRERQTIIFFFSDNGILHGRDKDTLYDGGIRVPLIVRFGDGRLAGSVRDDPTLQIDVAATTLALAGVPLPERMHGRDLFASAYRPRDFVVSARDRSLSDIDAMRSLRTRDFKYIRNFLPYSPGLEPGGSGGTLGVQELRRLHLVHELEELPARIFAAPRPAEELYDLCEDPFETKNLATQLEHAERLSEMREMLHAWMIETGDLGLITEPILEDLGKEYGTKYAILRVVEHPALMRELIAIAEATRRRDRAPLLHALGSEKPAVRYQACTALGMLGDPAARASLQGLLADDFASVRIAAVLALARLGETDDIAAALARELDDDNLPVTHYAVHALGATGIDTPEVREIIEGATSHRYVFTRSLARQLSRQFRWHSPDVLRLHGFLARPLLRPGQTAEEVSHLLLERSPKLPELDSAGILDELSALRPPILEEIIFKGWPRELAEAPAKA